MSSNQSFVLMDVDTGEYLEKVDAWKKHMTDDLQKARVYTSTKAAERTRTNTPAYDKGPQPLLVQMPIVISIGNPP